MYIYIEIYMYIYIHAYIICIWAKHINQSGCSPIVGSPSTCSQQLPALQAPRATVKSRASASGALRPGNTSEVFGPLGIRDLIEKPIGKPRKFIGKPIGKPIGKWENHGKTMGKWWFFMGFCGIHPTWYTNSWPFLQI